jgi:hypothetical protein
VSIKKVRAVSIGERIMAERDEETNDMSSVASGEEACRISATIDEEMSSSGRPTIAERRLRMKVFNVGRSSE